MTSSSITDTIPERLVPGTTAWSLYEYEHKQRYEFFASRCGGAAVLDAACGVGYGSEMLAKAGATSVVGADISMEALGYATQHFRLPNLQFIHCDVEQLSLPPESFDIVISFETIEHLRKPGRFIEQVSSVLRPNGVFICSTPNRDFAERGEVANPHHLNELSFDEFAHLFGNYFEIEERYYQTHTDAYRRHIQLVSELSKLSKPLRFSKLLRFENFTRRKAGRDSWLAAPLPPEISRAVQGDYMIGCLDEPLPSHLTFILAGRKKS
jgi:2-polyprenyl-3-methyl-5-hydroxy-6-metoxy-1,4-benzoquinol methylase